jgi:hypothetical protein
MIIKYIKNNIQYYMLTAQGEGRGEGGGVGLGVDILMDN